MYKTNGTQAQIALNDNSQANENSELRSSVGRFSGTNLTDIEGATRPYTSMNTRGIILGGPPEGKQASNAQIRISANNELKITGAREIPGKQVDVDASVSILHQITTYVFAGPYLLDAELVGGKLLNLVQYTTNNEVDASTRFSKYQPLINDSTRLNVSALTLTACSRELFYAFRVETAP